ncbi:MAG: HAMP domain-containing histidine kinase [Actinomycetota bacterium]|nr:HAMP domain-containing histidine kinase [Actinomycetota bacterium]
MLERLEHTFASQREFLQDAGHELGTPITTVRGHLELMSDDPDQRRETLALVTDELERMGRLVDDLLMLARSQRRDFLRLEDVDVAQLVQEATDKAVALAPRAWRVDEVAEGIACADRHRLTQALVQLASNAVQHTGSGDEIGLGSRAEGRHLSLWVRDTGPGVPPSEAEHIFEHFARGRSARRRSEGAGLGLPIVRAIAEAHGGHVALHSRPGGGATFTLVLPVLKEDST